MVKFWSTKDVPPRMARQYWIETMRERIFKAPIDLPENATLDASLAQADLGPLRVSWVDSPASRVLLPPSVAQRMDVSDDIQLTVMHAGHWSIAVHREHFRLRPRDVLFADILRGFDLSRSANCRTTTVSLSKSWLKTWIPAAELQRPQVLGADTGWTSVLAEFIHTLTPERVAALRQREDLLNTHIGNLLALIFHERHPDSQAAHQASTLVQLANTCIKRRFTEFGLTAEQIARELGVSERTLHRAYASESGSFVGQLLHERMTVARRMLGDPHFARLSVAEIGHRTGFSDPSHFIRRFRAIHGITPAALRRQLRHGP